MKGSEATSQAPAPVSPARRLTRQSGPLPASTPGHTTCDNISEGSRADYTVYTMKKGGNVVAVLMEAKLTSHSKYQHALGQVRHNSVAWIGEGPALFSFLLCSSLATTSSLEQMG